MPIIQQVILAAQVISAITVIFGSIYGVLRFKLHTEHTEIQLKEKYDHIDQKFDKLEKKIDDLHTELAAKDQSIMAEQAIHAQAIFGILDGQRQQGLNHDCQAAWKMMWEHTNKQAHEE